MEPTATRKIDIKDYLWLIVAFDIFLLDRLHKFVQIDIFGWRGGEFITALPILDYVLVWNRGVSYGLLTGVPANLIALGTGIVIAVLAVWAFRTPSWRTRLGLTMVIAGALSNWIDRLIWGAVADFFHLHVGDWSFYVFNIADAGITFGALVLIWDMIWPVHSTGDTK